MVKQWSNNDGRCWMNGWKAAMRTNYRPKIDMSKELDNDLAKTVSINDWHLMLGIIMVLVV